MQAFEHEKSARKAAGGRLGCGGGGEGGAGEEGVAEVRGAGQRLRQPFAMFLRTTAASACAQPSKLPRSEHKSSLYQQRDP